MTTTQDHEQARAKRVERVRAMFAKAASTEHDEERHAFEAAALRIMAEWAIEERELRTVVDEAYDTQTIDVADFGNGQKGACLLISGVAKLFGAFAVRFNIGPRRFAMRIVATPSTWEMIEPLVSHLLAQLRHDVIRERPQSKMSYCVGWADTVMGRLEAAQAVVYSGCNALVPTQDAARSAYAELWGRTQKQGVTVNVRDHTVGGKAGARADLGQQRVRGTAGVLNP